ncbi:MAG: KpsF/GutQ family sugar-phosphate isomerase [Gammaproteobacteria bacterium]|nr:KpsF/GutQ family sugar-phosphate isomerase [Gammaproteobacteria bacterium]MCK5608250.1 KpsF/GutQ family sugar-phosphate isomerase [Candidatus Pacearchaeota archaeon]
MSNHLEIAKKTFDIEISALNFGKNKLDDKFNQAVELIKNNVPPGRVIVMGMGKSGHIGNKIAATLSSTGTPAFFVHPAEAGHGDLGMLTKDDVVIAISQSGKSEELLRVMPYIKRNGIKLIMLTSGLDSQLAQYSDILIDTTVPEEACPLGLAPTASTTLTLALGDALAICLLTSRGFTENDFAETHPHGALGRKLLVSVKDVMSHFSDAPVIENDMLIKDALLIISSASLGFVIVVDNQTKPIGVFTDGDLRRCLDKDLDIKTVLISEVMSKIFTVVEINQLAVEAVELMEHHNISALPVVNSAGELVGAINMSQLLNAGIV